MGYGLRSEARRNEVGNGRGRERRVGEGRVDIEIHKAKPREEARLR